MQAGSPLASNKRRLPRAIGTLATFAVLAVAAACSSDSIAAPEMQAPQKSLIGDVLKGVVGYLTPAKALTRDVAVNTSVSKSALIGRNGGTIELKDLGLKLKVPSGAITGDPIMITVTAVQGKMVAYDFQPHGTQFAKPVQFEQSLDNTSWDDLKLKGVMMGGYFKSLNQLDLLHLTALLDEQYPVLVNSGKVSFDIRHFSGYLVSTGRSYSYDYSDMF